jgi:hypothetical protein
MCDLNRLNELNYVGDPVKCLGGGVPSGDRPGECVHTSLPAKTLLPTFLSISSTFTSKLQFLILKKFFLLKTFCLQLQKKMWKIVMCECLGVHRWVFVNKSNVGLCWGCGNFYDVDCKNNVISRVERLDRATRRRMVKDMV